MKAFNLVIVLIGLAAVTATAAVIGEFRCHAADRVPASTNFRVCLSDCHRVTTRSRGRSWPVVASITDPRWQ